MNFTAKNIQQHLSITKSRYEYIMNTYSINPSVIIADGTGNAHIYSVGDLVQFTRINTLISAGFTKKAINKMVI